MLMVHASWTNSRAMEEANVCDDTLNDSLVLHSDEPPGADPHAVVVWGGPVSKPVLTLRANGRRLKSQPRRLFMLRDAIAPRHERLDGDSRDCHAAALLAMTGRSY